jgi:hypothetical protein
MRHAIAQASALGVQGGCIKELRPLNAMDIVLMHSL